MKKLLFVKSASRFTHNIIFIISSLLFITAPAHAQILGVVEGTVTTGEGRPIADARITVPGTGYVVSSDTNGEYHLEVPADTYELRITRGGYAVQTVPGVVVAVGQTVTRNISLEAEMEQLVVMGRAMMEGSTGAVLSIQREDKSVIEVIGSDDFSRIGDSTAADTLQRITGLTVEDNKFVVIRGQPKRYTSTLFNGSQLPSLDPIQQITPLDLFPSGILSNIAVQKAYTADRPGSFGSGQVQLSTTGLPTEDFLEVSAGTAFNFETIDAEPAEFNTGDDIFAGVDAILRLPEPVQQIQEAGTPIATLPVAERNELGRSFAAVFTPVYARTGPDGGIAITAGKRLDTDAAALGASLAIDYGQKIRSEEERRRVLRLGAGAEPTIRHNFITDRTKLDTSLSGLLAVTGEWYNGHELKSNTFWIRDSTERVEIEEGVFLPSDQEYLRRFLLEYEQREMIMQQFTGSHQFADVLFEWRSMYSNATRELPDRRTYQLQNSEIDGSGFFFLDRTAPDLLRTFNSIDDETFSFGGDVTVPLMQRGNIYLNLKGGGDIEIRDRLSEVRQFGFNSSTADRDRPLEQIFADDNIGDNVSFTEFSGVTNDYNGDVEILGGYAQLDLELLQQFRVVAGLRLEGADYQVETFESGGAAGAVGVTSGFDRSDELPSLVGSWSISDNMQLRGGLARSISYPALVEISDTTFIDPDNGESFRGNPLLEPTVIDSADLRWEWYPGRDEALTIGAFYKDFTDPIERSFFPVAGGGETITFTNADQGEVYGLEVNARFGLYRLSELIGGRNWLDNFHIGGNIAWQESEVGLESVGTAATNLVRRMTGQPELLTNLELGYTGPEHIVRVVFGYVSDRLMTAGIQGLPDEFLEPRFDLKMKWSWSPSAWEMFEPLTLSLELENILDDAYERSQAVFITRSYKTGPTASMSIKWRFDNF